MGRGTDVDPVAMGPLAHAPLYVFAHHPSRLPIEINLVEPAPLPPGHGKTFKSITTVKY